MFKERLVCVLTCAPVVPRWGCYLGRATREFLRPWERCLQMQLGVDRSPPHLVGSVGYGMTGFDIRYTGE